MKKQLAVFASGTGTNFDAIARACADGVLDAEVAVMVCDKPGAAVIEKAARYGVETFVFSPKSYPCKAAFEAEIVKILDAKKIDLVCLAGYMRIVGETLLNAYEGKIINKVYGITIHWVNADLDGGKIIAQRAFEYDGNDPAEVHRLGQPIEHKLYVETIAKLIK